MQSISHTVTDCFLSVFLLKQIPYFICRVKVADILRSHSENADFLLIYRIFFHCKCLKKFQKGFFFTLIVKLHSIRIHSQNRKIYFLFTHAFQSQIIRCNHCRNRCPDHRRKRRIYLPRRIRKLRYQPVISPQNRIHISKSRTENRTFLLKPPRLVETTDIAGTASGITNHYNTAKFKKH